MKTPLTLVILGSSAGFVSAFTVVLTNQSIFGDPALPLTDRFGTPLASGTVALGFFDSDDLVSTNSMNYAALLGGFNEFGTATSLLGKGTVPGLIDIYDAAHWDVPISLNLNSDMIGENIYVIFGNGDSLASSDLLAVWKSDSLFAADNELGHGTSIVDLERGEGTLLLGNETGPTNITGGSANITITYSNSIGLVSAVPEPSTSLFSGLVVLALVIRRKR